MALTQGGMIRVWPEICRAWPRRRWRAEREKNHLNFVVQKISLSLHWVSLVRPAPAEFPQARKRTRVGG